MFSYGLCFGICKNILQWDVYLSKYKLLAKSNPSSVEGHYFAVVRFVTDCSTCCSKLAVKPNKLVIAWNPWTAISFFDIQNQVHHQLTNQHDHDCKHASAEPMVSTKASSMVCTLPRLTVQSVFGDGMQGSRTQRVSGKNYFVVGGVG